MNGLIFHVIIKKNDSDFLICAILVKLSREVLQNILCNAAIKVFNKEVKSEKEKNYS